MFNVCVCVCMEDCRMEIVPQDGQRNSVSFVFTNAMVA